MAISYPANILSHWHKMFDGLETSPKEFFDSLEDRINKRNMPDVSLSRVDWREGGIYSSKREYLRVKRENLIFDVSAAPFGTGFFFSWWFGEARPSAIGPTLLAIGYAIGLYFLIMDYSVLRFLGLFGFLRFLGYLIYPLALIVSFFIIGAFISSGKRSWDVYVFVIPLLGPLFERLFRPSTYHRIDKAHMFQSAVHSATLEIIDSITQAKGMKPLTELERKPIMRELAPR